MTRISRRRFLSGAATVGTAAAVPYPGPVNDTPTVVRGGTMNQPAAPALLPAPGTFTPLPLGSSPHNAFPSAVRLPDGQVRLMWREAAGHLDRDGRTMTTVGDPITNTWQPATEIVLDNTAPVRDMRPGALSVVDGTLWLTYFWWELDTTTNAWTTRGAWVVPSPDLGVTWGTSVRVDGGKPVAAVSAPVVEWNNQLVTPWYGRQSGEAHDTVWLSVSSDGGQTWTANRYVNALGAGKAVQEPWVLVRDSKLIILYRDGTWSNLALRESPDTGTSWPAARVIATQATGNSGSVWASNGTIYVVYRHTVTRDAMLLTSKDGGDTWQTNPVPLLRAPANLGSGSLGMTYASPVDLGDGMVWCPIGLERSLDTSTLYGGWL